MGWLQRLLFITPPEDTTLSSAELDLRGAFPWWVAVLLLVITSAAIFFLYFRERGRLGSTRRFVLALLRTVAVALVFVLLLRPVLLAEFRGERPRKVVLLLDNSQSMKQADRRLQVPDQLRVALAQGLLAPGGSMTDARPLQGLAPDRIKEPSRLQLLKAALTNPHWQLLPGLADRGPLQPFLFGRRLGSPREAAAESGAADRLEKRLLASLTAEEGQTALADALHELLSRGGGELPAAIVVMTDGRDNASKLTLAEAAQECRDRGVPLHIYGVGSSAAILQLKVLNLPDPLFVDSKPEVRDDPVTARIRWRCRGLTDGHVILTLRLGDQVIRRELPVREGEDVEESISFVPNKGREGKRDVSVTLQLQGDEAFKDELRRSVRVIGSRVKVLYVENVPRREYKFIQPMLTRDQRVLSRFLLLEGDAPLAQAPPDPVSGMMFLDRFPENFPEPAPRIPDRRPYDLLLLGDVPIAALGTEGPAVIQRFVREGGGLVALAGQGHDPAEYVATPLAEVLPVEVARRDFMGKPGQLLEPFQPVLTADGQESALLSLADTSAENLRLWQRDLWRDARGFYWHYPVTALRPGARALLVHPNLSMGERPEQKPMPLVAWHYYGKGQVLFVGVEETWRWRFNTGDRLTSRFWGQIALQLGLPHLTGNSERVQLRLEQTDAILGQPGAVRARLLNERYEPLTEPNISATLSYLDAPAGAPRTWPVTMRAVKGQPGEYRAFLPHDAPGRFELHVDPGASLESATLQYRVEPPPGSELQVAGLAEEELRTAAQISGGRFYREEDLPQLVAGVEPRTAPFVQRQEVLLWNPLAMLVFVGLLTTEWVVRKFSNLS